MALDSKTEDSFETLKEIVSQPVMIQSVNIQREELDKAVALKGRQETTAEVQAGHVEQNVSQEMFHTQLGYEGEAQAATAVTDTVYHAGVSSAETHSMLAGDANVRAHSAESQSQTAHAAAEGMRETVRVRQAVSEEAENFVMVQQEIARRATAAGVEELTDPKTSAEKNMLEGSDLDSSTANLDREPNPQEIPTLRA